jgi:hypothetical protein
MCPTCVTTAVLIAMGAFSSGGLAALATRSSSRRIANEAGLGQRPGRSKPGDHAPGRSTIFLAPSSRSV